MTFALSFEGLRNQFRVQESFMVLIIQFSKDIILILELNKPTDLKHVLDVLISTKWLVLFAYSRSLGIIPVPPAFTRDENVMKRTLTYLTVSTETPQGEINYRSLSN